MTPIDEIAAAITKRNLGEALTMREQALINAFDKVSLESAQAGLRLFLRGTGRRNPTGLLGATQEERDEA